MAKAGAFTPFAASVLLLASFAAAQEKPSRFTITGVVSGAEEYTVARSAAGTSISGHTSLSQGPVTLDYTYKLAVAPDCTLQKYDLELRLQGQVHAISAARDGDQIKMHVLTGGEPHDKTVPFSPSMFVMDNSITGDFQVMADCVDKLQSADVMLLVPQRLTALAGKLTPAGEETGTLNGKPVRARKYSLSVATIGVDLWFDASTHELLRIANAGQNFFVTREGFALSEKPAPQAVPVNWIEREVKFPSAEFQFPATLCLPREFKGKAPLVVLVHGSGPHDRDEAVGPNKPFADIAHALAAAGIATLRYDKRTFAFSLLIKIPTLTLDQEVTDDAVAALAFAAIQPEVDAGRLFVLGHSLGGTMAPYIAQKYPKLHGMVLLAAGARPIDQISAEQVRFQLKHEGKSGAEIEEAMKKHEAGFAVVRKAPATEMFNGISAGYMRDWLARDPAKLLRESTVPALVLQGGSDLQVSVADYNLLKAAIAGKPSSEAHLFRAMTHMFAPAPPNQTFDDIMKPAHVDSQVTTAIADWIKKLN
jgi:dienelactone hydrolase